MLSTPWITSSSAECSHTRSRWVRIMTFTFHIVHSYTSHYHLILTCLYMCMVVYTESLKSVAALLSDKELGPFRLLIVDSIIGKIYTGLMYIYVYTLYTVYLYTLCVYIIIASCFTRLCIYFIVYNHIHTYIHIYTIYTALFRVEFSGRGELSERQQKLGQVSALYIYSYATTIYT